VSQAKHFKKPTSPVNGALTDRERTANGPKTDRERTENEPLTDRERTENDGSDLLLNLIFLRILEFFDHFCHQI
jgi:hypothetical protein